MIKELFAHILVGAIAIVLLGLVVCGMIDFVRLLKRIAGCIFGRIVKRNWERSKRELCNAKNWREV